MLDFSHVFEVDSVGDAQAFHLVGVAPLLEVLLEGTATPVARPSADLTLELFAESVQFEQPVGDRFAIPAHWQVLRVVLDAVLVIVGVFSCDLVGEKLLRVHRVFFSFDLRVATRLLLAHLILGLVEYLAQDCAKPKDPSLALGHASQSQDLTLRVKLRRSTFSQVDRIWLVFSGC